MTLTEKLAELREFAAYKCSCALCSSRYCDDDKEKTRRYRNDVPALLAVIEELLNQRNSLYDDLEGFSMKEDDEELLKILEGK